VVTPRRTAADLPVQQVGKGSLMEVTDGLPLEQITAARPDLVLGTDYSGLDEDYGLVSRIAPTLSSAAGYNKDTWQTTTTRVGQALGRSAEATALIAQTEKVVADVKAANPGFAGKTFTIGPVQADGTINTISSPTDASARFMQQIGLTLSPAVTSLPPGNFPGRAVVSPESLNTIDADVLILTFNSPEARRRLETTELFQRIPAVQRGSYVALDLPTAIAIGFPSALSIPFALEQSVPKIAEALAR
jgi:iron complex transport system substrate-binding protein